MSRPAVSVITCARNEENYAGAAVQSILGQSFQDLEMIVVDDGSTDSTPEVLGSFTDPRLRVVRRPSRGAALARNAALELCAGEFVAIQDADDVAARERLAEQVSFLRSHPECGVAGSWYMALDPAGRRVMTVRYPSDPAKLEALLAAGRNPLGHSTVMFRRTLVERLGGYRPEFEPAEDYDLWLRASRLTPLGMLAKPLAGIRVRPKSFSSSGEAARQLRQCLLARSLVALEGQGIRLAPGLPRWAEAVRVFEKWFSAEGLARVARAQSWRRQALLRWSQHSYLKSLALLAWSYAADPRALPCQLVGAVAGPWSKSRELCFVRRCHQALAGHLG